MRGTVVAVLVVGMLSGCIDDGPSTPAEAFAWREVVATYEDPRGGDALLLTVSGPEVVEGPRGLPVVAYNVTLEREPTEGPTLKHTQWLTVEGHPIATRWSLSGGVYDEQRWASAPVLAHYGVAWALSSASLPNLTIAWDREGTGWAARDPTHLGFADRGVSQTVHYDEDLMVPASIRFDSRAFTRGSLEVGARLEPADAWPGLDLPVVDVLHFPGDDVPLVDGLRGEDVVAVLAAQDERAAELLQQGACLTSFSWDRSGEKHGFHIALQAGSSGAWSLVYDTSDGLGHGTGLPYLDDQWRIQWEGQAGASFACLDQDMRDDGDWLWARAGNHCEGAFSALEIVGPSQPTERPYRWSAFCGDARNDLEHITFDPSQGTLRAAIHFIETKGGAAEP